jgi:glutamyl-tRNA reductase
MAKRRVVKAKKKSSGKKIAKAGKSAAKQVKKRVTTLVKKKVHKAAAKVRRVAKKAERTVTQRIIAPAAAAMDTATQVVATTAGIVTEVVHSVFPEHKDEKPPSGGKG